MTISIGPPDDPTHRPWTDAELDALVDLMLRREARRLFDAQDAEAKRAAAKEKREKRKAQRGLTE